MSTHRTLSGAALPAEKLEKSSMRELSFGRPDGAVMQMA